MTEYKSDTAERLHMDNFMAGTGYYGKKIAIVVLLMLTVSCSEELPPGNGNDDEDPVGSIPDGVAPDIQIVVRGTKIEQLVGDFDREREAATQNQTFTRYELQTTDLGTPFVHNDTTFILFGDTWGSVGADRDAIAYTTDTDPEDGLALDFIADENQVYYPLAIPGISQGAFEVPMEGLSIDGSMYVYHTTDHSGTVTMGRSVLAKAENVHTGTFSRLYDFSVQKFINISVVQVPTSEWELPPGGDGDGLIIFGSGTYRKSQVYLAYQPSSEIEFPESIRYFAGVDEEKAPLWSEFEKDALPVFHLTNPCVGEFSVSYNRFIGKWIMLYNCNDPRGINLRTADYPWGPWSRSQIVFHPWDDYGYCHFIHTNWENQQCDSVHDSGRAYVWGGEYGPYQFEDLATGDSISTTIYFTLSTWNPYTVVLMKAGLEKK